MRENVLRSLEQASAAPQLTAADLPGGGLGGGFAAPDRSPPRLRRNLELVFVHECRCAGRHALIVQP